MSFQEHFGKLQLGQGVSAEALQISTLQTLLRKFSQQAKPCETDLKNKNQGINAVLFTVSLW